MVTETINVGDIVKFDNLRETFFLAEGTHVGEVISADRDMIVISVQGKNGIYQCPVPAPRVSHAYPDIEQPVGEQFEPGTLPPSEDEILSGRRLSAYRAVRSLYPELSIRERIALAEYLLTGQTEQ